MTKTKYLDIKQSNVYKDSSGVYYPDIFTFPIQNFEASEKPQSYYLTDNDISRFDVLMSTYYGASYYDNFVLWINNIGHIADVAVGTKILLPSKNDINTFIADNAV